MFYTPLVSVHAGPWLLADCELRCAGGAALRACEWGEVDAQRCVLGGSLPRTPPLPTPY